MACLSLTDLNRRWLLANQNNLSSLQFSVCNLCKYISVSYVCTCSRAAMCKEIRCFLLNFVNLSLDQENFLLNKFCNFVCGTRELTSQFCNFVEQENFLLNFVTLSVEQENFLLNFVTLSVEQENFLLNFVTLSVEQENFLLNFVTLSVEQENFLLNFVTSSVDQALWQTSARKNCHNYYSQ